MEMRREGDSRTSGGWLRAAQVAWGRPVSLAFLAEGDHRARGIASYSAWCPEGDLNPHNPCGSADFKSAASASFAIRACHSHRIPRKLTSREDLTRLELLLRQAYWFDSVS
jgi:hypothetical protein